MAADHRPLDTDEFISHFEEMPSRVPEEKARGQRGKTGTIRWCTWNSNYVMNKNAALYDKLA
jgi:hypothetical protein